ncbi:MULTISPECIES: N-acetylglucosamine/diacetylchitobiose ABC transporter substrate-binding protein [Dactylosporangium]|uniref:Carbohydrate ABC transporter, N-acetylglucosamine/diacetylchitobiose-binding protein n=2 Tax=Dactylosporangium TaxID=35753 RepID=A0A9W6NM08_9ACTN|nr:MULTISPECIES: N-acetylglucosamine/diacetylchitobiose ABC transporter substrate-binding protein [Dactylosporangium]UAB98499.1 carbohydrate ABC transporter, N-acetylglucosamine/diacetylchitobiose-binding protein [Dactylosporangium vinaceum]UWZ46757.1 N-acetylglucosamine/diacetylchitobiose ABC transporter substrate-binding protein [Dactylosporangium matsuzakiense]GLL01721.1 carbohydrate ABC transporter, N-acetylglucosamine/diacetylchitobiose-binding protein [Dactylosporangium matsuzakiense]
MSNELTRRTVLRRAAAAGLLATPAAGLLSACAGSDSDTPSSSDGGTKSADNPFGVKDGSTVKVVVFDGGLGTDYAKKDVQIFNAKHGNVTVNQSATQKIKTQEQPKMATTPSDLINNSGADIMDTSTLISENAIQPLDDLLDAPTWDGSGKIRDSLLPGTINDGTYNGKFYTLKYAYTVWGMWYNAALFEKNSWTAPKTWAEFFTLAPKIKAAGIAPFVYDGVHGYYPRWHVMQTVWNAAGKQAVIDIDNLKENAWKAPGILEGLQNIEKMVKDGLILAGSSGLNHTQSQQAHLDGKAAFIQVGTWYKNEMAKTLPPDFKLTLSNYWDVDSPKAPGAVYAGAGEDWVVPAKAANAAGAKEYLRAMLSTEGAGAFASLTKSLASVKGSGDKVDDTSLASANALMKSAPADLISFRFPDFYADYDKESQNLVEDLMAGRTDAAGFVTKIQAVADKISKDSSIKKQTRDK